MIRFSSILISQIIVVVVLISGRSCGGLVVSSSGSNTIYVKLKKGAADITSDLASVIKWAKDSSIDTMVLAKGVYKITAPLYLYPGLTVYGADRDKVIIEQMTWGHPAFDLLDTDSCTLMNLTIQSTQERRYPNGFVSRATDGFVNNAGIYSNSHAGTFRALSISGFTCGLFLSAWDGKGLYEQKLTNTVTDISVNQVDFGLLISGQKYLTISDFSGSYSQQAGSGAAPHLIYISGSTDSAHAWTEDFSIIDCHAYDSPQSSAFQFGSVKNGKVKGLHTDGCQGILSLAKIHNVTFDSLTAIRDKTHSVGSIFMVPGDISHITMDHIWIQSESPGARLIRFDGVNNVYRNIELRSALDKISDQVLVVFEGAHSSVQNLSHFSPNDTVGAVLIMAAGESLDIEDLHCIRCSSGFNLHPVCRNCVVKIDSREIVAPEGYEDFRLYVDRSVNAEIVDTNFVID